MTIVTYVHRPKRARKRKAQAATTTGPIIVTAASGKRGPKPRAEREVDPEVKAKVDAFFAHGATDRRMIARPVPRRHWRSYGDDPLPTGREALNQPFNAFPSWFMRITCDRCGFRRRTQHTATC
jgi:hypothetical protein